MAFIDHDEIKKFGRDFFIVFNFPGPPHLHVFMGIDLLCCFIEFFPLEDGIHSLDGADANLAVRRDIFRVQPPDVIKFRKFTVVVTGRIPHELLFGLLPQVFRIDQKQDAFGIRKFEQTVNRGDGGEGFPAAGRHLDQRTGSVFPEGFFKVCNRSDLAIPQPFNR